MQYIVIYIVYCGMCPTRKRKAINKEFIKNVIITAESVLKIQLYLLDFGICVAFTFRLRINVLLCGNMAGEIVKPLVFGKAARPRCFKNFGN
jgi:hypothetical protein